MKASPLKRHTPLRRKTGVRRFNAKRRVARHVRDYGEQAERCRELPCSVWGRVCHRPPRVFCSFGACEPHHEPPRSCGGRDRDTVPLCTAHHVERHTIGVDSFNEKYGVDLRGLAAEHHAALKENSK